MNRFNAFSDSTCASHTLSKNTNHKHFLSNMICNLSLIHRKFKSVPYPVAAKSCVSGVKSCIRNSQIPYLKANSTFKKSFHMCVIHIYDVDSVKRLHDRVYIG